MGDMFCEICWCWVEIICLYVCDNVSFDFVMLVSDGFYFNNLFDVYGLEWLVF